MDAHHIDETRLLKASQVAELLSITTRTVWRWSASGRLPRPVVIAPRCQRWRYAEIADLVKTKVG
jgi:predicted DNA-binding transcriptional regulator AlpA